jgi:hypothetical protein
MKSLFTTLALLMSVSAQAGLTADQAAEALNGPDCINNLESSLYAVTHPTWTETFKTGGVADITDVAITQIVLANLSTYRDIFTQIQENNKTLTSNQYLIDFINKDINENLNATGYLSNYSRSFAACMKKNFNFKVMNVTQQDQAAAFGLKKIKSIAKAVQ